MNKFIKERKYLDDIETYGADTFDDWIKLLQDKKAEYEKLYPGYVFSIESGLDTSYLEVTALLYYKDENEYKESIRKKQLESDQRKEIEERLLYERLHAKFNKS